MKIDAGYYIALECRIRAALWLADGRNDRVVAEAELRALLDSQP